MQYNLPKESNLSICNKDDYLLSSTNSGIRDRTADRIAVRSLPINSENALLIKEKA